jgi:hypothetical protein
MYTWRLALAYHTTNTPVTFGSGLASTTSFLGSHWIRTHHVGGPVETPLSRRDILIGLRPVQSGLGRMTHTNGAMDVGRQTAESRKWVKARLFVFHQQGDDGRSR